MAKRIPQKSTGKPAKKQKYSQSVKDWLAPANEFITLHSKKVAGLIFVLSLVLSSIYYFEGHNSPLKSLYKWENSDMNFFDSWARHIEGGDWLCDTIMHPFHDWHGVIAESYFRLYPDVAAPYYQANMHNGVLDTLAARKALINDIYKGKTYHQEPLYTYILAASFSIFGYDYEWIYFWQFLLGALTNVLVFYIGKRYFNALTGLLAAVFVMFMGSILVYEMVILRTTMTNFFTVLLLYLFLALLEKPSWKRQLAFGAASGITLMGQSYFILFLLPALGWFAWMHWKNKKEVAINIAAFIGAMLLVMSPLFYRNLKVGAPVNALASHGAMAYIPVNTKYAAPMESFSIYVPSLVKIRHDSEGKMIPAVIECLKTFNGIGDFMKIYIQKINGMFMWYEMPNNMSYYMYCTYAPILCQLPVKYYFIAPLGLVGLFMGCWRLRKRFVPFILMTVVSMVPLMVAGNLARYRTPLEILMALAAAYLLIELANYYIYKKWKPFFISLGLILLAFIYTGNIVKKGLFVYNSNDLVSMYGNHYVQQLIALEEQNKDSEYLVVTTDLMNNIPDYFFKTKISDKIYFANEADCCNYVSELMNVHLQTLQLFKDKQTEIAFYQDRINILKAKADKFYGNK
ncbi:MAG TPA: glycosyltransferase family 39 protein [Saprospiraceae bacterium]|nr:glycosyltransferase family 39 protein [Saprospiraceae bacterium]